jgi:predicted membrane channel-forming protein YqfA (hemolysin III family)
MGFRRNIGPLVVAALTGFIVIANAFIDIPILETVADDVRNFAATIAGFAMYLGIYGIFRQHIGRITRGGRQSIFSSLLLGILILDFAVGIIYGTDSAEFEGMYSAVYAPLTATTYALLGFWVVSAAYYAFRARNIDATIVLVAGLIAYIGAAPIGPVIWGGWPSLADFVNNVLNTAGRRGMILGIGLGTISFGLRVLLGYNRQWMGRE